jgi:hypothetical protein
MKAAEATAAIAITTTTSEEATKPSQHIHSDHVTTPTAISEIVASPTQQQQHQQQQQQQLGLNDVPLMTMSSIPIDSTASTITSPLPSPSSHPPAPL